MAIVVELGGATSWPGVNLADHGAVADDGTTDNGPIVNPLLAAATGGGGFYLPSGAGHKYETNSPIILPSSGIDLFGDSEFALGFAMGPSWPSCTVNGAQTTPASAATTFTLTVNSGANTFPMGTTGVALSHGVGVLIVEGPNYPIVVYYTGVGSGTTFTGCQSNQLSQTIANGAHVSIPLVWIGEPGAGAIQGTKLRKMTLGLGALAGGCGLFSCRSNEESGWDEVFFTNVALLGARMENPKGNSGTNANRNYRAGQSTVSFAATANANAVGIDLSDSAAGANMAGLNRVTAVTLSGSAVTVLAGVRINGGVIGRSGGFHFENIPTGLLIGDVTAITLASIASIHGQPGHMTDLVKIGAAGGVFDLRDLAWLQTPSGNALVHDTANSHAATEQAISQYKIDVLGALTTDSSTA